MQVAPATRHSSMQSLILLMMLETLGMLFLKVALFRSCHISQHTSSRSVLVPFRHLGADLSRAASTMEECWRSCHLASGASGAQPVHELIVSQAFFAIGHSQNRCLEDSRFRVHSWQKYSFFQPRRWSLSLHHSLFCSMSQANILIFPGAQAFHMILPKTEDVMPWNCNR